MRKIVMKAHANTVGTDTEELMFFSDKTTDKQLDAYAQEFGQEHWNSYEEGDYSGEGAFGYTDPDEYYEACDAWWEVYDEDEHGDLEGRDA